ncbi:MAG: hypothetical protein ABIX01_12335 [Chitinophagaceae bacterium]
MKIIFLFLLGATSFIRCNNTTSETSKKDSFQNNKDSSSNSSKSLWTENDEKKFMDNCVKKSENGKGGTKDDCSCILEKAEQYFSSYESYATMKEDNSEWQKNGDAFNKAVDKCIKNSHETDRNNKIKASQEGWTDDNIAKFKREWCKGISLEESSCKLAVAMKYAKNPDGFDDLILFSPANSDFNKDLYRCHSK